ncbi:MAG: hypothetical protein WCC54_12990 [Pseudolabrys sp.]|jgi:hypothetical protein
MFGISRAMKFAAVILAAAVMLISLAPPSYAESGTVRLRITRAGFIVGAGGGTGTLVFHGRTYPLSVGGLSVGTFGAATADVVGRAFNLRRAQDIVGTYTAVGAGVAIAGGATAARLRNQNGVVIEVRGRQIGLEASLNLSGMSVALR